MAEAGPDFTRAGRNRNRKGSSTIVNILIGVVVLLIIIVAMTIFLGNKDDEKVDDSDLITTDSADNSSEDPTSPVIEDEEADGDEEGVDESATENTAPEPSSTESSAEQQETVVKPVPEVNKDDDSVSDSTGAGSVTYVTPDDEIIAETIINATWQPIGTTQTGEHASQYDRASVDWVEKQQALAYATGLSQDSMIFWKIKNGGGPQKSVGIVSSTNKAEKYRVYLEWVDGEGWKPVKMDVLNTLDFDY